jgi:hypothetical protein
MKKLILLIILLSSKLLLGQETHNNIFEDIDTHLYKSKIIEKDSTSKDEFKKEFENVAARLFLNFDEVVSSETEDQIILNFILQTKSIPTTSWNVRLISEFKDDRMRIRVYDFGNAYIPSGEYTPTWKAGSIYVTNNKRAVKKRRTKILTEWTDKINALLNKIESDLKNPSTEDDW